MIKFAFIKCTYYVFKLLGLFTAKINFVVESEQKIFFTYSKNGSIYNVLLIFILIIFNYFHLIEINLAHQLNAMNALEFKIVTARIEFNTAFSIFLLLHLCLKQEKFIFLLTKTLLLRRSLFIFPEKVYFNENYSFIKRIINFCLINFLTFIVSIIMFEVALYNGILSLITKYSAEFLVNYAIVQYTIAFMLINHIFIVNNKNFHKILIMASKFENEKLINFYLMHDSYFSLCQLSEEISKFYDFHMLLSILYIFLTLVVFSYYVVKFILIGKCALLGTIFIHCLFKVLNGIILLIFVTKTGSDISSEVREFMTKDRKLKNENQTLQNSF